MKNRNICKFVSHSEEKSLRTTQFIFETQWNDDAQDQIAQSNRILLVTNGKGKYCCNGVTVLLETGDLLFILAGEIYRLQNEGDLQFIYINYSGERANDLHARFGITEKHYLFETDKSLISIWKESIIRANEENLDLLCESMLLYAFSQIKQKADENTETVQQVIAYISEHFNDPALSLTAMAQELGYNAKYLSHLIVKKLGVSFSQYVTELRLRESVLLIHQGLTSIKNISILCGFGDPLYYSKVFKAKFGYSPKTFIQKESGGEE